MKMTKLKSLFNQHPRQIARLSLVLSAVAMAFAPFQNCAKVEFATADNASVGKTETPVEVQSAIIRARLKTVPSLKMVFIVDNSYTMKANQVNLGRSFEKMFDPANSESLAPFDTTAILISTAQRTPELGQTALNNLLARQKTLSALENETLTTLLAANRGTTNSGVIPGDNVGFSVQGNSGIVDFLPAPVLGFEARGNGLAHALPGMHKDAKAASSELATEFQKRIAILDNSRIPADASGVQENSVILDNESGLCAMARMLRNSNSYFSSGDEAAFVIATDEDEADPEGLHCIQSQKTFTGAEALIKGRCEQRQTVFKYGVPSMAADTCAYKDGYSYKYSWSTTANVVTTKITYRKIKTAAAYSVPRTKVSYSKETKSYKLVQTTLTYETKTCTPILRDGVKVGENCSYSGHTAPNQAGDVTSKCAETARRLDANASLDSGHAPVCARVTPSVASCVESDPNCLVTTGVDSTPTLTVEGTYASGTAACTDLARSLTSALVDASHPVTCTATTALTGSGACPADKIAKGCNSTPVVYEPTNPTVSVSGDYTTSAAACLTKAKTLAGAAVDETTPPTCEKVVTPTPSNPSVTGTLTFAAAGDGGTKAAPGNCDELKSLVLAAARKSNAAAPDTGTCQLTGYHTATKTLAAGETCNGTVTTGVTSYNYTSLPAVSEQLACSDLCSQSRLGFCAPAAGITITSTMTIETYLKEKFGAGVTCQATNSVPGSQTFTDRLESEKASLCTTEPYRYLAQEGDAYHKTGTTVDFVTGTRVDSSGKEVPALSLSDYIEKRGREVFQGASLNFSAFVRRSSDPQGDQGSTGVTYEKLSTRLSGQTVSILAEDFSPALVNLGAIIKDRLDRSFLISDMAGNQRVRRVLRLQSDGSTWKELDPSSWTANGRSVTFASSVSIDLNDTFKFEYY
jgi:hypothetical protein